jgi:hypothetical protein
MCSNGVSVFHAALFGGLVPPGDTNPPDKGSGSSQAGPHRRRFTSMPWLRSTRATLPAVVQGRSKTWPHDRRVLVTWSTAASRSRSKSASRCDTLSWNSPVSQSL